MERVYGPNTYGLKCLGHTIQLLKSYKTAVGQLTFKVCAPRHLTVR